MTSPQSCNPQEGAWTMVVGLVSAIIMAARCIPEGILNALQMQQMKMKARLEPSEENPNRHRMLGADTFYWLG